MQIYPGKPGRAVSAVMGNVPFWHFSCAELGLFGGAVVFITSFNGS